MNFPVPRRSAIRSHDGKPAFAQVEHRARTLAASLPTNRAYLDALGGGGQTARERAS